MPNYRNRLWIVIFACGLAGAALCPWIGADDAPRATEGPAAPVAGVVSDPVVLDDAVYRLEWKQDRLVLIVQSLSAADREVRRIETTYRVQKGQRVSQIAVANFRSKGLIAALKITGSGTSEFAEMAFWRAGQKELDGKFSAFTFLKTDKPYGILAISNRHGIFVFVGMMTTVEEPGEGYTFHDGCPWPCMSGTLSPYKAQPLPIDQPLPLHDIGKGVIPEGNSAIPNKP